MLRPLLVLVGHDLRQHLRDRSMLLFALVIPFSLAFVFSLAFAGIEDLELDPVTVAVSAPEGDEAAAAVVEVLRALPEEDLSVTVQTAAPDELEGLVDSGAVELSLELPEGFGAMLAGGTQGRAGVVLELGPEAGLSGDVVADLVRSTVQRMEQDAAAVAAAAETMGDQAPAGEEPAGEAGPPQDQASSGPAEQGLEELAAQLSQLRPEVSWTSNELDGESLSMTAAIVAGQAGMFLFFTVGFAVLTLLTQREWGTLARLRTMPMPRWLVPAATAIGAVLLGVASTSTLLLAGGFLLDGVDFGSWWLVLPLVVAVVVAATSVMFIILKVSRTSEQASLATAVVAISLGVGGGTFFPIPATGWLGQLLQLNPVAALVRGLGITAGGGGGAQLAPVLLALLVFTAGVLVIARVLPGRKDAL